MAADKLGRLRPALYLLGLLGTYHTWGRTVLDGSLFHLLKALHGPHPYVLPGTDSLLRTTITGIYWPVDYLLNVLIVFFWEAIDGSHPATSAIGIYFLPQLFATAAGLYVDSLRVGQPRSINLFRTTLWLLLFQLSAIACTGSLWALGYIAATPLITAAVSRKELSTSSRAPARQILFILPSLLLGYAVPAVLMALPSPGMISNSSKQLALVAWNVYPVTVYLIFHGLSAILGSSIPTKDASNYRTATRILYATSLLIGIVGHVWLVSLSLTTLIFPNLWAPEALVELHPASLMVPPVFFAPTRTVGDGVRSFFLWDQICGYPVGILVAWLQLRTALVARDGRSGRISGWKAFLGIVCGSVVVGPGSVCVVLNWMRDEALTSSNGEEANQKDE